jgi:hypothetical protein
VSRTERATNDATTATRGASALARGSATIAIFFWKFVPWAFSISPTAVK